MANYQIKLSKNDDQSVITIKQDDAVVISTETYIAANVYSDDLSTAINSYVFTTQDLIDFKADGVAISTEDLIGSASPDDDFYSVELVGIAFTSFSAGVAITLEAKGETYNKQGFVDIYSPDYRIDEVLHTAHMLVQEMDNLETQDYSLQKRVDFTTRLASLKQILSYE